MRKLSSVIFAICIAAAVSLSWNPSHATDAGSDKADLLELFSGMGRMDPKVCSELQNRIDNVVSVSRSTLSESEKVAQLSEVLSQSLAALSGSPEHDTEVGSAMKQYQFFIQQLLTTALASAKTDTKKASVDAQDDLKRLKILTSSYVGMMKLLCPGLKLPDEVNKP